MATTTIKVNVESNLEKEAKLAKAVKDELQAAGKVRIPSAVHAAREGVTASSTPVRGPSGTNLSRGIAGQTGAEGRDFAKQAQGLGGLVHVYATFAANIFAVSAAFGALSRAADTTNMVKGLDQLGAVAGKSLGSLSKQLAQVTDGAITMRDAMTATVSASAGGMSSAAILRMGLVAKQASQALGVAMPDALNRISRGITKLEPELLDEIGIMVRVDTASQAYARTLGKTASSLTDFEKRQGFANAVLEQGEKKFGAIKLDTNPYDKILASMQNIAQTGLELVNKVLSPIVSLLSSSPAALATVMAGIGVILLKQAIPAIGMFREHARRMSEETTARVRRQVEEQRNAALELDLIAAKRAETEFLTQGKGLKRLEELKKASFSSAVLGTEVRGLLKKSPFDLTDQESAKIVSKHKELQDKIAQGSATKKDSDQYAKLEARAAKIAELQTLVTNVGDEEAINAGKRESAWWTHQQQKEAYLKKLEVAAKKSGIVSNAAENAATMGPSIAFRTLKSDLASLEGSKVSKIGTAIQGAFAIATSAVSTFMSAISGVMMVVGLVVAGFGILNTWLSSNSKESEKFSNSLTGVSDSFDNMSRTLDVITSKDPLSVFSVETIQARANALQDLSDSLKTLTKDFNSVQQASSGWDRGMDALWDAIGKGSADKLSTNVAKAISAGLAGAATDAAKTEAITKLQKILGTNIDVTNIKEVEYELRKLNNPEAAAAAAEVSKILSDISRSANNVATDLANANARLTELGALVQAQNLALSPTDAIGKLGTSMVSAASDMTKALNDPVNSMLTLNKLLDDSKTLSLLSPSVSSELIKADKEIKELNASYGKLQSDLAIGEKSLADLKGTNLYMEKSSDAGGNTIETKTAMAESIEASIARIKKAMVEAEGKMASVSTELSTKVANDFVNIGLSKLNSSLKTAMSEGAVTAAKGYLSVLKDAGVGTADAEAKLAQQELGMQKQVLDATYKQIQQQQRNTNALELSSVTNRILANTLELSYARTQEAEDLAKKNKDGLDKEYKDVLSKIRITEMKPQDALQLKAGGDISTEVLSGMSPYLSTITGYLSGLAKLGGQAEANRITAFAAKTKEDVSQEQKGNTTRITDINTKLQDVASATSLSAEYSSQLNIKKESLELEKRALEYANDKLKVEGDLRIIEEARKGGKVSEAEISKAILANQEDAGAKARKFVSDNTKIKADAYRDELKGLEDTRLKQEAKDSAIWSDTQAIKELKLAQQSEEIKYLESIGAISATNSVMKQSDVSLAQQATDFEKQRVELAGKYVTSYIELDNKKKLASNSPAEAAKFQEQQDTLLATYLRQLEIQDLSNLGKVTAITLATQQEALAKSQVEQMDKMKSATESLATLFSEMGDSVGKVGEAILQMNQDEIKYLDAKAKVESIGGDTTKLDKDATNAKLSNMGKVANTAKKLFKEETVAYKVLDGMEKASAMLKLAGLAEELAVQFGIISAKTVSSQVGVAGTMKEMAAKAMALPGQISAAITNIWESANPYVAAGLTAAFLSLIGKSTGGGSSDPTPPGMTSEEMQQSQGTGKSWEKGILVDNGRGVFGDSSAKSETIVNALEILKDNSILGLDYDNKLLKAMERVADAVAGAAKSIYSVPGLRQGTNFGTAEGSADKSGFGGDIPIVGKLFSSIFGGGSSTSTSIVAAGVRLNATFEQLTTATEGTVDQFKNIRTVTETKGGWFSSDRRSDETSPEYAKLADPAQKAIRDIFKESKELFTEIGGSIGVTSDTIKEKLASIPINIPIDLKGLTGEDLLTELNGVIGSILDGAAKSIFSSMDRYKNFGEGYLQTAIRVVDGNNKIDKALKSMGNTFDVTKDKFVLVNTELFGLVGEFTGKFDISEAIIKSAGSLENFVEQSSFFTSTFLSDAEKLAPVQKSVSARLVELGVSSNTTREEFKNLVLAQDLSTDAGRKLYQNLMDLAPGFDVVVKASEELNAALKDQALELLSLKGFSDRALQIQRADKLKELAESNPGLVAGQREIYLQQDINKTQELNIQRYTAEGDALKVLSITRQKELDALSATDKVIKQATFDAQDKAKTESLSLELLNAQGRAQEALAITREKDLKGLSETDKAIKQATYAAQDKAKTDSIALELLNAQGKTLEVLALTRAKELKGLSETDKVIKLQTYAQEDLNKTKDLELGLMTAQGKTLEVLALTRAKELKGLSETDKVIKLQTYTQEDLNKTKDLEIELAVAQGYALVAVADSRAKELSLLSSSDAAIKQATYAQIDANKTRDLEIQILNLTDRKLEALNITRDKEIKALSITDAALQNYVWVLEDVAAIQATMNTQEEKIIELTKTSLTGVTGARYLELQSIDALLHPTQLYIYMLEDKITLTSQLQTQYDKESSTIKGTITDLKSYIKTLKDFRESIALGDKSILNPKQKYEEAGRQLDKTVQASMKSLSDNATDEEKSLKADAISKIPELAGIFLDTSRTLYASSAAYTKDYNKINAILNETESTLTEQITTEEKSLNKLSTIAEYLESIKGSTDSSSTIMSELLTLLGGLPAARVASEDATVIATAANTDKTTTAATGVTKAIEDASSALVTGYNAALDKSPYDLYRYIKTEGLTNVEKATKKDLKTWYNERAAEVNPIEAARDTITTDPQKLYNLIKDYSADTIEQILPSKEKAAGWQQWKDGMAAAAAATAKTSSLVTGYNDALGKSKYDLYRYIKTEGLTNVEKATNRDLKTWFNETAAEVNPIEAARDTITTDPQKLYNLIKGYSADTIEQMLPSNEKAAGWQKWKDGMATAAAADLAIKQYKETTSYSVDDIAALRKTLEQGAADKGIPLEEHYISWAKTRGSAAVADKLIAQELGTTNKLALKYGIPAFEKGGYASGVALVGEKGPELVDFVNPGRVYSNKASNDFLNNKELIEEVKKLRQELSDLRKEQKEQTGHLIASNFDANARNAEAINKTSEETASKSAWRARSQASRA